MILMLGLMEKMHQIYDNDNEKRFFSKNNVSCHKYIICK